MKDLASVSEAFVRSQEVTPTGQVQMQVRMIAIEQEDAGQRIDNFLIRICKGVPKSHVYQVLRSGQVRVNKGRVAQTYRLVEGDMVRIPPMRMSEREEKHTPAAEFKILLEDNHLLVIDKPAGVAVHGGSGVSYGVIEQLRASRPEAQFLELVHRLDRETSGILMLAKKRSALTHLHEQIRAGTIDKRYLTLVYGEWKNSRQHVKLPLFKYTTPDGERRVRVQTEGGLASHTIFNLLRKYGEFALLEAELKTGRTHQIRVHFKAINHPVVCDPLYAPKQKPALGFKRLALHARSIEFTDLANKFVKIEAPLPPDFEHAIALF
jgi:23S rRNA pseudouridine955/2504/2580 synthase